MHGRQCLGKGHANRDDLRGIEPPRRDQAGQAAACGVVEHEHQLVPSAHQRAEPYDVRMVHAGQRRGFAAEPVARGQVTRSA
jgi:hypothetical protein